MIDGDTKLIAHIGYPTATFRAPLIYNPWFARHGINALVVPLGVRSENFGEAFPQICRFTNFHGALITMPHKAAVVGWLDDVSAPVRVAGACNAVRRSEDGKLVGDMFDGEGFVRGVARAGRSIAGKGVLIVGAGGVGSAIAASCAKAGAGEIALTDTRAETTERLAERLRLNRFERPIGFRHCGQCNAAWDLSGRSLAYGPVPPLAVGSRRRGGASARDHPFSCGRKSAGAGVRDRP
jgi:shikimate dehydrogenase